MPATLDDAPNAGLAVDAGQLAAEERSRETIALVRDLVVPRLLREAHDRGWWDPLASLPATPEDEPAAGSGRPTIVPSVDAATWSRLTLAARVIPPADQQAGHALVLAAILDGAIVSAALDGRLVVGLAMTRSAGRADRDLIALGVSPQHRRKGLGTGLLRTSITAGRLAEAIRVRGITVAERDPVAPLDRRLRASIARRLLEGAGFAVSPAIGPAGVADPAAIRATVLGRTGRFDDLARGVGLAAGPVSR